ncbi:hypothetical protein [Nocardia sp. NBC_00511]|uniref:hypothetical protein n=1 Tax=Nocardia sp. NBC_00511 TaxID=2903591 RepID=UPI0030DE285B
MIATFFIALFVYLMVGTFVANNNFEKKHGLRKRMFHGNTDPIGLGFSIMPRAFVWPLLLLVPALANPQLCGHARHIEGRERGLRYVEDV